MTLPSEPRADSRDMIGAHISFRREFAAIPGVIGTVAPWDAARAATVADHVDFVVDLLHHHHTSEDEMVWPRLHERCPEDVAPLIGVMQGQHHDIDLVLRAIGELTRAWRTDGDPKVRDRLADAAAALPAPLNEHLDLEEAKVLPLIDAYLSDREWKAVVAAGASSIAKPKLPLVFGMTLYDADAEMIAIMKTAIPRALWLVFAALGRRAYASHAKRVFGTSTPRHFDAGRSSEVAS
jgi:hemerythrin-like domain-containing protein